MSWLIKQVMRSVLVM